MTFHVVEAFTASKTKHDDDNEDVYADGPIWTVVCDGTSDKSGYRLNGRTGGWHVSRLIAEVFTAAGPGATTTDLLTAINLRYDDLFGSTVDPSSSERPSAVFTAFNKIAGTVVRVGDVTWTDGTDVFAVQNKVEAVHVAMRSNYLRMLLAEGATVEELLEHDPARALILPSLRREVAFRNRADVGDLAFPAVDGRPIPDQFIEKWTVGPNVTAVMIASDGYPRVLSTLDETETYLQDDLLRDPLRIGRHAGTKAPGPGFVSFDDRTYVRLTRDAS